MKVRRSMLKNTVTVSPYTGDGAYGPIYGAAVAVKCNIDSTRRLLVNGQGEQVISETTLQVHPYESSLFTPEATVTISGNLSRVIAITPYYYRGDVFYVQVACT